MESDCSAELVEGGVDLVKGSVDGVVVKRWAARLGICSKCGEWAEQTGAEFDE